MPACMPLARTAPAWLLELRTSFQIIGEAVTVLLQYSKRGSQNGAVCACQRKGKLVSDYIA